MRYVFVPLGLGIALGLFPPTLAADVVVSTSLNLTQLQIQPSNGTLYLFPITASAFGSVYDSLGGADFQFDSESSTASIHAATTLATADAAADAGALTASASSSVSLLGVPAEAGTNNGGPYGDLSGGFEIIDSSGGQNPVSVTFSAALSGNQSLFTDSMGLFATSEVVFNLWVNGPTAFTTELSLDNLLQIGPSANVVSPFNQTLTNGDTLLTNTFYSFDAQVDAESYGLNTTPEPSFFLLIGLACAVLFAHRTWRTRGQAAADPLGPRAQ